MNRPSIALMVSTADQDTMMAVNKDYLNAIWNAGGIGVVLPYTEDREQLKEFAENFDGFLFCGGVDIDPSYYGEEIKPETKYICSIRDSFEYAMFHECFPTNKPILGICRGEQVINVFLGGTLHQHIDGHVQAEARHKQTHRVTVNKGSMLHRLLAKEEIMTNSFHHQCVKKLGKGLICDAVSEDGYIEAYHSDEHPFCLGVQWHPESYHKTCETSSKIFAAFINACK